MYIDEADAPAYPKFGATVAKLRKLPRTPENVRKHFDALMAQLATMHRRHADSDAVKPRCPCASGTWHTDGHKILAAVNAQNRAGLDRALADSWKQRTDRQVEIAYRAALEGKHAPLVHIISTWADPYR